MHVHQRVREVAEPADMVEVQVGLHDVPDVARIEAQLLDLLDGSQRRVDQRAGVDLGEFPAQPRGHVLVVGAAQSGVDQDQSGVGGLQQ